jgi:hypothetical protein
VIGGRLIDGLRRVPAARATALWVRHAADVARIRRDVRRARKVPDEFDRAYGVTTRVVSTLGELCRTVYRGGFTHEPSPPRQLRKVLEGLGVPFRETVFVDYGSGAGRAVLVASEYPFKEIIGIELAPSLHARAEANVRTLTGDRPAIRLLCGDATTFELPPEPAVLYLYNPFGVASMRRLLGRVETSLARRPRAITVVLAFCYKDTRRVFEASRLFRLVSDDQDVAIFRNVSRPSA